MNSVRKQLPMTENVKAEKIQLIEKNLKSYKDFPKPGILFLDIFSILNNIPAFGALIDLLLDHLQGIDKFDVIVGLDARGFLLGPILALQLSLPFVPIRKKGKLPGVTKQVTYDLEYGSDTFEIQADSIAPGKKIVLIDDLLATGGSLAASCQLIKDLRAEVVECLVILEIKELKGRTKIPAPVYSLLLQ